MASNSGWGYVHDELIATAAPGDSAWGYIHTELTAPAAPVSGSWGAAAVELEEAHRPYLVLLPNGTVMGAPMLVMQDDGTLA